MQEFYLSKISEYFFLHCVLTHLSIGSFNDAAGPDGVKLLNRRFGSLINGDASYL